MAYLARYVLLPPRVIVGFEADGDVVVNDPAGASNGAVRRVYDRDELEDVWINASGGTAYVINR